MFAAKNFVTRYVLKAGAVAMFGCLTLGLAGTFVPSAHATTIATFDFTQTGWITIQGVSSGGVPIDGPSDPGGVLSGSFTGTIESDGHVSLADLTSFSATYSDTASPSGLATLSLDLLSFFDYATNGGASSLAIEANFATGVSLGFSAYCEGAPVALAPFCQRILLIYPPPGTFGAIYTEEGFPKLSTSKQPTIVGTLPPPPPPTATPEPASLLLLGTGLLALSFLIRRRQRRALSRR